MHDFDNIPNRPRGFERHVPLIVGAQRFLPFWGPEDLDLGLGEGLTTQLQGKEGREKGGEERGGGGRGRGGGVKRLGPVNVPRNLSPWLASQVSRLSSVHSRPVTGKLCPRH